MRRRLAVAILALVAGGLVGVPSTRAATAPCVGRFVVSGSPIGPGAVAPAGTFVEVALDAVEIPGVCTAVAPKVLKANKKGVTKLKAEWPISACQGFTGKKVVLAGKIGEACSTLNGSLKAKKAKRKVQAALSRCGDGILDASAHEACDPPATASCDASCQLPAGDLPQALGITNYAVVVGTSDGVVLDGPIVVALKDSRGDDLGTITSTVGDAGLKSDFTSLQGETATMETYLQDRDDLSPPRRIRSTFRLGDRWLQIDLAGEESLEAGWLDSVTLSTNLDPGAFPPSLGSVVPGKDGLEAVLSAVEGGQLVIDEAALRLWLQETGLEDLGANSFAVAALFATQYDENLLLNIASHFTEGVATAAQVGEIAPLQHKGAICAGVLGISLGLTGGVCGACVAAGIGAFGTGGLSGVLALPACGYCKYVLAGAFFPWIACKASELTRTTARDCDSFECPLSDEPKVDDRTEHECWCTCNPSRCATYCTIFPQQLGGTFPDGSTRPALPPAGGSCLNNSCVCAFDPAAYCLATFSNYCAGARRKSDRSLDIDCPRAKCGDGRWDETCPAHPLLNEVCDGSAPSNKTGNCGFGQGCDANCQCVACTCGADTDTPTCPKGDKGAYCGVADCQCHEGCVITADCPSNKTCIGGTCLGEGSLRITLRWEGDTDLDLHVITPLGHEINYANREADGGTLDVDQCVSGCASGTENVFFTNPPSGTFTYWAVNYNGKKAVRATFRVVNSGGDVLGLESEFVAAASGAETTHFTVP